MNKKRILLISTNDPTDIKSFSGITYHAYKQLERVSAVDTLYIKQLPFYVRMYGKIMALLFKKQYRLKNSIIYSIGLSRIIQKEIKKRGKQYDYLFFFNCIQLLAYFDKINFSKSKIIYYSDATFQLGLDYYPALANLLNFNIREGHKIDREAYKKADLLLFSSEWSANSAINTYGIDASRIRILKYGANLPDLSKPHRGFDKDIKLLIVGVDWHRKGINVAIDVHKQLLALGYASQLTIIGLKSYPKEIGAIPNVHLHTFIDKSTAAGILKLKEEFEKANYFIFPTLADCTPIVLAEAMMFGLPIIARNTGGISSMVKDHFNGFLIGKEGGTKEFVDAIISIHNQDTYNDFSNNSRQLYERQFNWNAWLSEYETFVV